MAESIERNEIAFVFGAGASQPFVPMQGELIPRLWEATNRPYSPNNLIRVLWPSRAYLGRVFSGFDPNGIGHPPRFEDVVGPLELSESEEYWFHLAGTDRQQRAITNRQVLDSLDTWIALCLDPETVPKRWNDERSPHFYGPSPSAEVGYGRLISLLRDCEVLNRTVFVSLNYDVLLDRCLLSGPDTLPDYRVEAFCDDPSLCALLHSTSQTPRFP